MKLRYIVMLMLCAYLTQVFISCSDDESFTTSPSCLLSFEKDTLNLDTVFSTIPSPHKQVLVRNNSIDGLRIVSAKLKNGNQTGFRVNVNGTYLSANLGYQVNNLELRKGDSLRVFVELTSTNNLDTLPKLVSDDLIFTLESGVKQKINLKALSWDAFVLKDVVLTNDTIINSLHGKPVVVYGDITVKENSTLTISPGTTIYFHNGAGMDIRGTLKAFGEKNNEITLRCDRLDRMVSNLTYDNNPGQWRGITIRSGSFNNEIVYTDIHGATTAFQCDSSLDITRSKLNIRSSTIHNMKGCGVRAINSNINIENTQISNVLDSCLFFCGGNITINNSTIAQYYPFDANRGPALAFSNAAMKMPLNMNVKNSVIKGYQDDVIFWTSGTQTDTSNIRFENCLLRTPIPQTADSTMFINNIHEDVTDTLTTGRNSFRLFDTKNFFYDFTPTDNSPAIGAANPDTTLPQDRKGKNRNRETPDMGCYETDKK